MYNPFHRHHHPHSNAAPFAAIITDVNMHVRLKRHHYRGDLTLTTATIKGTTPTARVDGTALALTDIASLDVFDDIGDGNGPQKIGSVPNPADTFSFTTGVLAAGVLHTFTVVVNDTTGHKSAPSNPAAIQVPATLAAPAAVADLAVTLNTDDGSGSAATTAAPAPAPTSGS